MSTQLPIFRAKKIDSDEYVIGDLVTIHRGLYIAEEYDTHEVEEETISIHFPDMTDRDGNKIFASLSADGKGGDMLVTESSNHEHDIWDREDYGLTTAIFNNRGLSFSYWSIDFEEHNTVFSLNFVKVAGIKQ